MVCYERIKGGNFIILTIVLVCFWRLCLHYMCKQNTDNSSPYYVKNSLTETQLILNNLMDSMNLPNVNWLVCYKKNPSRLYAFGVSDCPILTEDYDGTDKNCYVVVEPNSQFNISSNELFYFCPLDKISNFISLYSSTEMVSINVAKNNKTEQYLVGISVGQHLFKYTSPSITNLVSSSKRCDGLIPMVIGSPVISDAQYHKLREKYFSRWHSDYNIFQP